MEYYAIQLFNGLSSQASFYVLLSLGLTIIFGMLGVVNMAHGAFYMLGGFIGYVLVSYTGSFWLGLVAAPLLVGGLGALVEARLLRRLYGLDALYQLLLTFGLLLFLQDAVRMIFGPGGKPVSPPEALQGVVNLGFIFFPKYRLFVMGLTILLCLLVWWVLERTQVGAIIRAGTEDSLMVDSLGINISRYFTLVFAGGAALAAVAGALTGPVREVEPFMGLEILVDTFVVVVVGGMGSVLGSIVAGVLVGLLFTLGVMFYPEAAKVTIFALMILVLWLRPRGLFGREAFHE